MSAHRRLVSESSAPKRSRPLSIFSPQATSGAKSFDQVSAEFIPVISAIEAKKEKVYHEGHLLKLNDLSADGSQVQHAIWERIYASLSGTVFSYWPASEFEEAETLGQMAKVAPRFLNITDAQVSQAADTSDITISTAGKNRHILRSPEGEDTSNTDQWMLAVRLSMYERARLQEIYTSTLFSKFRTKDTIEFSAREEKWSGFVDARMTGMEVSQRQWKRFWCVVLAASRKNSITKRASHDPTRNECEIRFYANKKDKMPEIVMNGLFAAYCTYPEHISLIGTAGIIKLEGQIRSSSIHASANTSGCALLIPVSTEPTKRISLPRTIPTGPTMVQRILKFLYCVWTTFELYNSPRNLLLNVDHADALGNVQGSVDLAVTQIIGCKPADSSSEAAWRTALRKETVLSSHPFQELSIPPVSFKRVGNERRVVSEGSIMPPRRTLITSLEEDEENERTTNRHQPQKAQKADFEPRIQTFGISSAAKRNSVHVQQPISVRDSFFVGLDGQRADLSPKSAGFDTAQSSANVVEVGSTAADRRPAPGNQHLKDVPNSSFHASPSSSSRPAKLDTNLLVRKPAQDEHSLFTISPLEHDQVEVKYPEQGTALIARRTLFTRAISHDSHHTLQSDVSNYSDGLDPNTLDLVTPVVHDTSYAPSLARHRSLASQDDREGSIYSTKTETPVDDMDQKLYGSNYSIESKPPEQKSVDSDDYTPEKIQRRVSAVEALDIPRKASVGRSQLAQTHGYSSSLEEMRALRRQLDDELRV